MNQDIQVVQPREVKAPKLMAVICLLLAWFFAVLPVPIISTLLTIAFNVSAFILAIICLSRNTLTLGISVLVGTIFTFVLYFFSYPFLIGSAFLSSMKEHRIPAASQHITTSGIGTEASTNGTWNGEYFYSTMPSVKFSVELKEDNRKSISGQSKEIVHLDANEQTIEAEWIGIRTGRFVKLDKTFMLNGTKQKIRYEGNLSTDQSTISGNWSILGTGRKGTFKLHNQNK